jgi:voltage-gated potassium channel
MEKDKTLNHWRERIHTVIFGYNTFRGKLFDIALMVAISLSVLTVMLESVQKIDTLFDRELYYLEWGFTFLFTIEYIARVLSYPKPKQYIFSMMGLVDLLSLIPTYLGILHINSHQLSVIRTIRLIRIFRILKLTRYMKGGKHLAESLYRSRHTIIVFLGFILCTVVVMGTVLYIIEGGKNGFTSIPISIYWAIVTLTTVGYGDISPTTVLGQAVASLIMVLGYAVIAVPTGVVTSELMKSNKKTCRNCKKNDLEIDTVFCRHCGHKLISQN